MRLTGPFYSWHVWYANLVSAQNPDKLRDEPGSGGGGFSTGLSLPLSGVTFELRLPRWVLPGCRVPSRPVFPGSVALSSGYASDVLMFVNTLFTALAMPFMPEMHTSEINAIINAYSIRS